MGKNPDEEYCLLMLEKSGVCVVPGNGFGQRENTHHFRIAFLPPLDAIKNTTDLIQKFQKEFIRKANCGNMEYLETFPYYSQKLKM